jgi:hypothetical protein
LERAFPINRRQPFIVKHSIFAVSYVSVEKSGGKAEEERKKGIVGKAQGCSSSGGFGLAS